MCKTCIVCRAAACGRAVSDGGNSSHFSRSYTVVQLTLVSPVNSCKSHIWQPPRAFHDSQDSRKMYFVHIWRPFWNFLIYINKYKFVLYLYSVWAILQLADIMKDSLLRLITHPEHRRDVYAFSISLLPSLKVVLMLLSHLGEYSCELWIFEACDEFAQKLQFDSEYVLGRP